MKKNKSLLSKILAVVMALVSLLAVFQDELGLGGPGYEVVRVVDGDTIIVKMDGKDERVRFIGVDTPESVHPDPALNSKMGKMASDFTKDLLDGQRVGLELDVQERDRYGRVLAYVYLDDEMVQKTLLSSGYAQVATFPPNVKYVDDFLALEARAREAKLGFWADEFVVQDEAGSLPDKGSEAAKDGLKVSPYPDRSIKGNINASGEKIYHVPGQRYYDNTVIDESLGERWFATEKEAEAAGWRKASR